LFDVLILRRVLKPCFALLLVQISFGLAYYGFAMQDQNKAARQLMLFLLYKPNLFNQQFFFFMYG
jgi:hypothetical protein